MKKKVLIPLSLFTAVVLWFLMFHTCTLGEYRIDRVVLDDIVPEDMPLSPGFSPGRTPGTCSRHTVPPSP